MKKQAFAFVLLLAFTVGGGAFLWCKLRLLAKSDIAAAFAMDLHEYVLHNAGKLPSDWKEFERWDTLRSGKTRWPANDTAKRVQLLHPPYATGPDSPRYIAVIDPDLKGMERYINRFVLNALLELSQTNAAPKQAAPSNP